jgi:hypothetical protein
MAKPGQTANQDAVNDYSKWEGNALSGYNTDVGNFVSNTNSAIAQGNPYESKSYLTNQNILTSGAMNSAKTAANAATADTARRTGGNTAAVQASRDATAQGLSRQQTQYNAQRDTDNLDKWLGQRQQLYKNQLDAANSEANIYGSSVAGRSNGASNLADLDKAKMAMTSGIISGALGAGGTGVGAWLGRK